MKELSCFWTVTGCPVVTVFLGDRRCAPTPPCHLSAAPRLPQPPRFDISAPETSMDQWPLLNATICAKKQSVAQVDHVLSCC